MQLRIVIFCSFYEYTGGKRRRDRTEMEGPERFLKHQKTLQLRGRVQGVRVQASLQKNPVGIKTRESTLQTAVKFRINSLGFNDDIPLES